MSRNGIASALALASLLFACAASPPSQSRAVPLQFMPVQHDRWDSAVVAWHRGSLVWVDLAPNGQVTVRRVGENTVVLAAIQSSIQPPFGVSEVSFSETDAYFAVRGLNGAELFRIDEHHVVSPAWRGEASDFLQVLVDEHQVFLSDDYGLRRLLPAIDPPLSLARHTQACISRGSVFTNSEQAVGRVDGAETASVWSQPTKAILALNCSDSVIAAIARRGSRANYSLIHATVPSDAAAPLAWKTTSLPKAESWGITRIGDELMVWSPKSNTAVVASEALITSVTWDPSHHVFRMAPSDSPTTAVGVTAEGFVKLTLGTDAR